MKIPSDYFWLMSSVVLWLTACEGDQPFDVPTTTESIGSEGGQVVAGDASIAVPVGALDEPTEITVAIADGSATIDGFSVVGPFIEILPSGTTFNVNAVVTLPFVADELPADTRTEQIVVMTAPEMSGEFEPLETTVNDDASTVAVEVSHLSIFVAVVPTPETSSGFEPCPTHGECDCSARDERPLEQSGSASLGRFVSGICFKADELHAATYIPRDDPDPFAPPEAIFDVHLDPVTLEVIEELPFEGSLSAPELCQRPTKSYLAGGDGVYGWSARFIAHDDDVTGDRWYEAILTLEGLGGSIDYSFNAHLNEDAFLDTNAFYDNGNSLVGRVRPNGSASFFLHIHAEAHVDAIHIEDVEGALNDPGGHVDEYNMGIPTARDRYELFDDPGAATNFYYAFNSLNITEHPDDDTQDLLTVFGTGPSLIRGFIVDGSGAFDERPELGLDSFWSQFGWQNAGMRNGVLHLQSEVASFSNSLLLELDPVAWTVARQWELGCIGPPTPEGFQLLDDGTLVRFAYDALEEDLSRVMLLREGELIAIADIPFDLPMQLVHPEQTHVYAADIQTGEMRAYVLP